VEYKLVEEVLNTEGISQTITTNNTQSATGSNSDSGWVTITSTFTTWVDSEVGYDYLGWTPAIDTQSSNFNQNQNFSQDQTQYEQPREQNSYTGAVRNLGTSILQEQTVTDSESRTISVTNTGWQNHGGLTNCSSWSPDVSTIPEGQDFTQTQLCEQIQKVIYTYKFNATSLDTHTKWKTINQSQNQQATGEQITRWLCSDILNDGQSTGNGVYSVDPDGALSSYSSKPAYCDMSGGGWTLYDDFGTINGTYGGSTSAYNRGGINSSSGASSAGYSVVATSWNAGSYHVEAQYLQFFNSGSPQGFLKKTLPNYVDNIRIDKAHDWHPHPNTFSFGGNTILDSGSTPRATIYLNNGNNDRELIMLEGSDGNASIIWIDALWIK
jgi:hypothetical protein